MAISAALTFSTVSSCLPLNLRIFAVSFMALAAPYPSRFAIPNPISQKAFCDQVATDHDNDTGSYEE
jgi:hypothetical protein